MKRINMFILVSLISIIVMLTSCDTGTQPACEVYMSGKSPPSIEPLNACAANPGIVKIWWEASDSNAKVDIIVLDENDIEVQLDLDDNLTNDLSAVVNGENIQSILEEIGMEGEYKIKLHPKMNDCESVDKVLEGFSLVGKDGKWIKSETAETCDGPRDTCTEPILHKAILSESMFNDSLLLKEVRLFHFNCTGICRRDIDDDTSPPVKLEHFQIFHNDTIVPFCSTPEGCDNINFPITKTVPNGWDSNGDALGGFYGEYEMLPNVTEHLYKGDTINLDTRFKLVCAE